MAPGYLAPRHHRTRYASPLTFPRRSARNSENALRTTISRPAGTTIVERLFDHAQDTPIHSICVDEACGGLESVMAEPDPVAEVATAKSAPGTGSVSNQRLLAATADPPGRGRPGY